MTIRHFLTLNDLSRVELDQLINRAIEMKTHRRQIQQEEPFKNSVMTMIFEKASTRTRVSFETGMTQLGGHAMFLSPRDSQLGRGEPIEDSARVLSSMTDIIIVRTFDHTTVERFADYSSVPIINALTDDYHPCQLLADMQTYREQRGSIKGKTVVWVGDGNNMCQSYINAARQFDFNLRIACPKGFEPQAQLLKNNQDRVLIVHDPKEAAKNADLFVTDVWASMGQEEEQKHREKQFSGYQINHELMALGAKDAIFMHCLPAHRGEEVSCELMNDPNNVVWSEAENRLHSQKALIEFLLLQTT